MDGRLKTKICDFAKYCPLCIHRDLEETKDPCNECLAEATNEYSEKPVKFKEDKK